jgi:3,4-dihydroxy 2-butanone 4-phosphate synthase / GTP cyclohydrolase II
MPHSNPVYCDIPEALDELRAGRMIVLTDDEFRENEGDLVLAAEKCTPQAINFMMTHGRGLICLAMTEERADRLGLEPQTVRNTAAMGTAFTVSVDARVGITTGQSVSDKARTVAVCMDDRSTAGDLVRPGHLFPLRAKDGGVLVRAGHTEGGVDLAKMAGLKAGALICEIHRDDGEMARTPDLIEFCKRHGIKMCTIQDLIQHRRTRERLIEREIELKLPTVHGEFDLFAYRSLVDPQPHLALTLGGVGKKVDGVVEEQTEPVLVRVHSECLTGDAFGSLLCDCGPQFAHAMEQIAKAGKGVLLYMRQEGRGIGLLNKLHAYRLQQEEHLDTVEANQRLGFAPDLRQYGIGAQILHDLGVRQLRLLTNNPKKVVGIDGHGLTIVEKVPIEIPPNERNRRYLETKYHRLGHELRLVGHDKEAAG